MKKIVSILFIVSATSGWVIALSAIPPFSGTIFLDPDIITPSDPTTYLGIENAGRGNRRMFDRRINGRITLNAFLFNASYLDGPDIEFQINPEFDDTDSARNEVLRYAPIIGQLPKVLRKDVKTVSIHKGVNPFGGGNNNLLIHSGQGDDYITSGILEETLVHEASHTSLDAEHANASDWLAAQAADDEFITTYARDNANREDIAESFLVYMAIRHRADRISESLLETIETTIPNRIAYFDNQDFDLFPIVIPEKAPEIIAFTYDTSTHELDLNWVSQLSSTYSVDSSVNLDDWKILSAGLPSQGITTQVKITVEDPPNHIFFRIREE